MLIALLLPWIVMAWIAYRLLRWLADSRKPRYRYLERFSSGAPLPPPGAFNCVCCQGKLHPRARFCPRCGARTGYSGALSREKQRELLGDNPFARPRT